MDARRYLPVGLVLGVVIGVQLLTAAIGAEYYLTQLTMAAYYVLVVLGLCLVMGYAGQISLGHAGFFAIGGYCSAVLTTVNLDPCLQHPVVAVLDRVGFLLHRIDLYGRPIVYVAPWMAALTAVLVTAAFALLIGIPVLRLRGHYLAMATLGFGTIIHTIVNGTPLFGEADGISKVPPFPLVPGLSITGELGARVPNYYIAWGIVILCLIVLTNLIGSRVGRALRAIHGAEDAAEAMGVDTARYKLYAFVLSAVLAAIGGICLTHYGRGIAPAEAGIMRSVRYVAIVAIGGMGNLWGTLAMGVLLSFLSLRGCFGAFDDAVFGGILIAIMLFAPEGLLSRTWYARARHQWQDWWRRVRRRPAAGGPGPRAG